MAKTIKMNSEQMGRMFREIYEDLEKTLEENGFMKIWASEEMTAEQRKEMIAYYWNPVKNTKLAKFLKNCKPCKKFQNFHRYLINQWLK